MLATQINTINKTFTIMKKQLYILALLFSACAFSQGNFGLTGGLKILNIKTDAISIDETKPGFEIGAFMQSELGAKSDMIIELAYSDNGIVFNATDNGNDVTTKYNFTEIRGSWLFHYYIKTPLIAIQVGPSVSMQKINLGDGNNYDIKNYKFDEQDITNLKSFNFFATIGLSVGNERIRGNLRYYHGFSNMLRDLESSHSDYNASNGLYTGPDNFESKQSFFTLSVAYRFGM